MNRGPKLPRCPRHPDSRVWRDGSYETRRGVRQRYRCVPLGNARPHRFVAADAETPHGFSYTAREIAAALVEVGRGASYRAAAAHARERADAPESTDGNTVAGWVESFAPAVFRPHAVPIWPDVVALDSVAFSARTAPFRVFVALGAPAGRARQIVALEAFAAGGGRRAQRSWERFLRSREGAPRRVVCAAEAELLEAVDAVWEGEAVVAVSPLDLARQLRELLLEEGFAGDERFFRAASRALESSARWQAFLELPAPRRLRTLEDWLSDHAERVEWQLEHDRDATATARVLEEKLSVLDARLAPRRGNLRNRRRTNCLLLLAQLDLNGQANERAYARAIENVLKRERREA
jgi:hypothetical protein